MSLEILDDFAAAGEAQLLVKFTGFVEEKYLLGLLGEESFGLSDKSEVGITMKDVFELGNEIGLSLNEGGASAGLFLAFFPEFLGGFCDEK